MASPDVLLRRLAQSVVAGVRDKAYAVRNGRISALDKADVGLSDVDNTSDAAKPVSTATQTALSNKVDVVAGKQLSTEDYTTAEKTKLSGIAPGATANQTDASLLSRANHTGTQAASTISDLTEAVQDVMGATLVQGANVTITYDDVANTLTIAAASGGGTVQPWSAVASVAATATLALADAGKYLRCTSTTAVTLTVPPQTSVAWAADTEIHIEQGAAGAVTIAAGAGVTINKPAGYNAKTMSQYAVVTLKRVAADTWTLIGALEVTV